MAGLGLKTGLTASAVGNLYGGYGSASVPAASTVPEGPTTITQQGFGVPPAGGGKSKGLHAAAIGTGALILLAVIWWTLPRLGDSHAFLVRQLPARHRRVLGVPALHRHGQHRQGRLTSHNLGRAAP